MIEFPQAPTDSPNAHPPAASPETDFGARLERIEHSLARIDYTLADMGRLTGMVTGNAPAITATAATVWDAIDEALLGTAARGIDLDAVLRGTLATMAQLGRILQAPELERLLGSGLLEPAAVSALGAVSQALVATSEEPAGKAGFLALLSASRDPDIQRTIDFTLRFMKRCGQLLAAQAATSPSDDDTPA